MEKGEDVVGEAVPHNTNTQQQYSFGFFQGDEKNILLLLKIHLFFGLFPFFFSNEV